MATKTGFIAPPWPHVRGDSVSAASLISRIEKKRIAAVACITKSTNIAPCANCTMF